LNKLSATRALRSVSIVEILAWALSALASGATVAQTIPPPDEKHATHEIGTCGGVHFEPRLEFCDARDGRIYRKVTIGSQTWMAENLDYGAQVPGSQDQDRAGLKYCLYDQKQGCAALYQWAEAVGLDASFNAKVAGLKGKVQGVCPAGWHVPAAAEWAALLVYVDREQGKDNEAVSLMAWSTNRDFRWKTNTSPDGMLAKDRYGFAVVPTGDRLLKGTCPDGAPSQAYFCSAHDMAKFWTSDDDPMDPRTGVNVTFIEDLPHVLISSTWRDALTEAERKSWDALLARKYAEQSELQRTYKDSQKYQGMAVRCLRDT